MNSRIYHLKQQGFFSENMGYNENFSKESLEKFPDGAVKELAEEFQEESLN